MKKNGWEAKPRNFFQHTGTGTGCLLVPVARIYPIHTKNNRVVQ
jgi:hypothetical protein